MKTLRYLVALCALLAVGALPCAHAAEPEFPDYILKAQTSIGQAETRAAQLKDYADDVLIAKNLLRNAEAEYKKNLSWSGKLDEKAAPTVKYYAAMAQLQAAIILSRAEKIAQEKERARLEAQTAQVKGKIKVFDDKNAEIAKRDATINDLNKRIAALNADLATKAASGSSAGQKAAELAGEVQTLKWSLTTAEQKVSELTAELATQKKSAEKATAEVARLKEDLAQKGAEASQGQEQLQALTRSRQFVGEVGKLGGVMKTGSDGIVAIYTRSSLIKTSVRNVTVTPAGEKLGLALAELLRNYPEYRAVVKVHGFGASAKSESAAATDQMARLLREVAVGKGKLDPAAVEALGVGQSEPIYPKSNPEGNRRVEITFVKKQTK